MGSGHARPSRGTAASIAAGVLVAALAAVLPAPAWAAEPAGEQPVAAPPAAPPWDAADAAGPAAPSPADDEVPAPDLSGLTAALQAAGAKVAAASQAGLDAAREAGRLAAAAAAAVGGVVDGPVAPGAQGWAVPLSGSLTDGFGWRLDRPAGANPFHRGADIAAPCGSTIHAATDGVVLAAGPRGTYGNWILLSGPGEVSTGYAHIADGGTLVEVGDEVEAGEAIALVGSTGASTGCHLHFEVRISGAAIDPLPYMVARDARLG